MNKFYLIFSFLYCTVSFCQNAAPANVFHSPQNIKLFADHLFCSGDYLRAVDEYNDYLKYSANDTVKYKIALSYLKMDKLKEAEIKFNQYPEGSVFYNEAFANYCRILFLQENYTQLKETVNNYESKKNKYWSDVNKLSLFSGLIAGENIDMAEKEFLKNYDAEDVLSVKNYYERKAELGYVNPLTAAIFSAIIPGTGKIYAGETGDGFVSMVLTGLFGYLAFDNFSAKHLFRGYLFTGIGLFFYASDIYGSAAQAEIFNAKLDFNFNLELKSFLSSKNYFLPKEPEFCR